ncbi:cation diffusion facilitator CzcD-associated flavoprotein CzcO [Bradyrhizobium elkanii]
MNSAKTVAIIGAGPVGLAAAAHLMERDMTPVVLEAGAEAGHAVSQWQHVQLFSPWEYNVNQAAARLLADIGWNRPDPTVYPTGGELLDQYLVPLATRTPLKDVIRTSSRVTAISRAGFDKAKTKDREKARFEIRYQNGKGPRDDARRCRDRQLRHLDVAEPGGRQRACRHRRARSPTEHRLWDA